MERVVNNICANTVKGRHEQKLTYDKTSTVYTQIQLCYLRDGDGDYMERVTIQSTYKAVKPP